jgi:dTDP-4-dehydrorhamnose reductase
MRLLLFGANGQVGRALRGRGALGNELTVATRQDCDLTDAESVRLLVRRVRPEVIVNAAAYTAVDKAESDREICFAVNAAAPRAMAEEAAALGAKLVHYSTDYVFDGMKATPYVEEDATGPRNVYGASKLAGEEGIAGAGGVFILLRTSWVYSNHGANFLKTMLRLRAERPELRIVADQHGAPTSADAIATATMRILTNAGAGEWTSGVYHMTAGGATSWYGFAKAIFARAGAPTPALVPIETAEYPTPAARPANSVLSNEKFAAHFGFRLPEWEEQLDAVMAARAAANEPEVHAGT